ncbi:MAG: hypothetical protein PUI24_05265, partial [Spirochaetales bacterium]|nr:hypothetical protein [Spirochaetales bacterium]
HKKNTPRKNSTFSEVVCKFLVRGIFQWALVVGAQHVWSASGRPAVRVSHGKRVMGKSVLFKF